jgi:predicted transcriptional regulator
MPKLTLNKKQKKIILDNRDNISATDIAKTIGVSKGVVQRFLKKNNLSVSPEAALKFRIKGINKRLNSIVHPEDEIIKSDYLITPVKALATKIGRSQTFVKTRLEKLGLEIPSEIIEQRKLDSRKKKGCIPLNKGLKQTEYMSQEQIQKTIATRFKKGQIHHNAVGFKDGDIVTRHSHKDRNQPPYKWIRLGKGKWEMYHVNIWKEFNGPVPDGHIIVFKDKNTMNTTIDNLECITKAENMIRNTLHRYPEEIKKSIQTLAIITRKINRHEKQNQ